MQLTKQNKKGASYLGKDKKHLVMVVCNSEKMSITIQSASGVQFYCLDLIPQDGDLENDESI